jgi:hypothetical protein
MPSQTPNVFTYPRNEPGTQGHLDLVEALRTVPRDVANAVKGIREAEARYRPEEGAWCIKEIAGHLRDAAEVYHKRLYLMSTQTDPVLEPYDPDAYARDHNYLERDLGEMLAGMEEHRARTVRLLTTLVNWNWARTGQHLEDGRMSIRQIVELMIDHEAGHLAEIHRLRILAASAD